MSTMSAEMQEQAKLRKVSDAQEAAKAAAAKGFSTVPVATEQEITLYCACCRTPFAFIRGGCLVVESKHHGEKHVNTIPLINISELLIT